MLQPPMLPIGKSRGRGKPPGFVPQGARGRGRGSDFLTSAKTVPLEGTTLGFGTFHMYHLTTSRSAPTFGLTKSDP